MEHLIPEPSTPLKERIKAIARQMEVTDYQSFIDEVNKGLTEYALEKCGNQTKAANLLKITRGTFRKYSNKAAPQ